LSGEELPRSSLEMQLEIIQEKLTNLTCNSDSDYIADIKKQTEKVFAFAVTTETNGVQRTSWHITKNVMRQAFPTLLDVLGKAYGVRDVLYNFETDGPKGMSSPSFFPDGFPLDLIQQYEAEDAENNRMRKKFSREKNLQLLADGLSERLNMFLIGACRDEKAGRQTLGETERLLKLVEAHIVDNGLRERIFKGTPRENAEHER
jgi:hypothetical protein